jgi:hypothetical protein
MVKKKPASTYPFPLIGAGTASYLQWCEVYVAFERAPTATEHEQIVEELPKPLGTVTDFDGPVLFVMGGKPRDVKKFERGLDVWLRAAHAVVPIRLALRRHDLESSYPALTPWHHTSLAMAKTALQPLGKPKKRKGSRLAELIAYVDIQLADD